MTYSRFDQYLTELDYLAGIIVKRSRDVRETAAIIKALWTNFQSPPDEHNSLHQIYSQPVSGVLLTKPGLVRRVSKEFDGIGWKRSRDVAEMFKSVQEMANAPASVWMTIEGIGKKTAEKVVEQIKGGQQ
jgi:ERCC4-type nuclease